MEITEVRVILAEGTSQEHLLGFGSITFDNVFVVHNLKIIEGVRGPFVAMPSRKLTDRCPKCGCKNHLRARFCNHCGTRLDEDRAVVDESGRAKLHADIAHPITAATREIIREAVIAAYEREIGAYGQSSGQALSRDDVDFDPPVSSLAIYRAGGVREKSQGETDRKEEFGKGILS